MAEIKDSKLIRDALGSPVPQYWDETSQMYIARTVDGSFADVDFSKVRLLRDKLGSPIPQLWDIETAKFVPGKGGGNGEVTIESVPGLRAELDETNASLAETATKTELAAVASGAPKGTYATLTALQTAFPTGNTNIYLVTADGKWYYWSGSAWAAGGVYQATSIPEGSVLPENTSFITQLPNLIDRTKITLNKISTQQGIADSDWYDMSGYIRVTKGQTYTFTKGIRYVTQHNLVDKAYVKLITSAVDWQNATFTFTADADSYILATWYKVDTPTIVLNKGTTADIANSEYGYVLDTTKVQVAASGLEDYLTEENQLWEVI